MIPRYLISCKVLIRNIPIEFSEQEIHDNIEFPNYINTKVIHVRRIKKRLVVDGKISYTPTHLAVITLSGVVIPECIMLYRCVSKCELYIPPVIQCRNCMRYGHIRNNCKSNSRCHKCGFSGTSQEVVEHCRVCENICCLYCKGGHSASEEGTPLRSRCCPEFYRQQNIKEYMVSNNVSFFEALKMFPSISSPDNRDLVDNPIDLAPRSFPQLSASNSPNILSTSNNQRSVVQINSPSFSQVVSSPRRVSTPGRVRINSSQSSPKSRPPQHMRSIQQQRYVDREEHYKRSPNLPPPGFSRSLTQENPQTEEPDEVIINSFINLIQPASANQKFSIAQLILPILFKNKKLVVYDEEDSAVELQKSNCE